MSRLLTTVLLALAFPACATPTPPSPPVRFPDLKAMTGAYTLTIDLDDGCSAMPAAARHRVYRATRNSFDFCGDVTEPLADGSELAVCGEGPVARSEFALSGALTGYAFISRGNAVVARCEDVHQFSFEHRGTPWP